MRWIWEAGLLGAEGAEWEDRTDKSGVAAGGSAAWVGRSVTRAVRMAAMRERELAGVFTGRIVTGG